MERVNRARAVLGRGVGAAHRRRGRPAARREWALGPSGYAPQVLTPLSVTGVVVFTACLVLAVLAGLGIVALLRGRRGE